MFRHGTIDSPVSSDCGAAGEMTWTVYSAEPTSVCQTYAALTVTVTNVLENEPPTDLALDNATIAENSGADAVVATIPNACVLILQF